MNEEINDAKENEQASEPPKFKPSQEFLRIEALDILRNLPPNTWDKYAADLLLMQRNRWHWDIDTADAHQCVSDAIEQEAEINTARYREYVASGGRVRMKKDPFGGPDQVEILPVSKQTGGFVMGGRITGDQIILETEVGTVNTSTDRILTFRLFQQDVLRSTCTIYDSRFKKQHEDSVRSWLTHLSRVERREDDDTMPVNILRDYVEEWLQSAETEPMRFETSIRQKHRPILKDDKEYYFSPDTLAAWLKVVDKERKWKKSEIKIYLQTIYGDRFTTDKRLFDIRTFAIMRTRPDVPPPASLVPKPDQPVDQPQVQHDGGSGEDHAADPGHTEPSETGGEPARDPDPVLLESNSDGGEGTPAGEADPF